MNKISLEAIRRTETGKGPARRLRAAGQAPAILYGKKKEPLAITINVRELLKAMEHAGGNPIFDLDIMDNGSSIKRKAILKERQIKAVDGELVHLDFLEISSDEAIEVSVHVEFDGTPVGVENGGELQVVTRELRVSCLPDDIPRVIVANVAGLDIGKSLHLSDITLPEGVVAVQEPNTVLASVAGQKPAEEEQAAEPTEAS